MVIESKVAKAKVTESNTGWIEIPEHDPALQVKLCKRIFENSADVEARGLLAVNNLRYAGKVAEAFSSALREEYGFTPSEINSKTAEFTMRAAMSPSYVATRPFKNYLASTVMFGFRNLIRDLKRRNISYSLESYLVDEEENLDKLGFMEDKSVPLPSRGAELADERKNLEFLIRENLTEKQQQHIYFSYFGELDRKEVANLVGCTSANVGISINRSLETLRDVIGQEELAGVN